MSAERLGSLSHAAQAEMPGTVRRRVEAHTVVFDPQNAWVPIRRGDAAVPLAGVSVPGAVVGWVDAHERFGSMPSWVIFLRSVLRLTPSSAAALI